MKSQLMLRAVIALVSCVSFFSTQAFAAQNYTCTEVRESVRPPLTIKLIESSDEESAIILANGEKTHNCQVKGDGANETLIWFCSIKGEDSNPNTGVLVQLNLKSLLASAFRFGFSESRIFASTNFGYQCKVENIQRLSRHRERRISAETSLTRP